MDVKDIVCKVDLKINKQKLEDFVGQYISEIESGTMTYEELHSLVVERLSEFVEINQMNFLNNSKEVQE